MNPLQVYLQYLSNSRNQWRFFSLLHFVFLKKIEANLMNSEMQFLGLQFDELW